MWKEVRSSKKKDGTRKAISKRSQGASRNSFFKGEIKCKSTPGRRAKSVGIFNTFLISK